MEGNEGIAPVWNLNEKGGNGLGDSCGMWFMWIIVIFALMGGGGWGWLWKPFRTDAGRDAGRF